MNKPTILIIEDEERIASWIKIYVEREGYSAVVVHNGKSGLALAQSMNPNLIILDLMLPGLDGMEICRRLRRSSDIPIIMLTAKGTKRDKISGLDCGADDYILKPFDPDELVVRIKAVLRRYKGQVQQILRSGRLSLDEMAQQVCLDDQPLHLSHAQFAIMRAFISHPNIVLTRFQLIEQAFENDYEAYGRAIDAHIKRLRKILNKDGFAPIETIYGSGYKLVG
jgi:DNA-binding response OmpR family regulator